jgi:hypothetical protein
MDESEISKIGTALAVGKSALEVLGRAIGLISDNSEREAAKIALEQARHALSVAEVQSAAQLGHLLHHCDFPPGICVRRKGDDKWVCRKCGGVMFGN